MNVTTPKKLNIKAIVFDFGGVIQFSGGGNLTEKMADLIGVSQTDFKDQYFKLNHLSNVKNIPWNEMIVKVIEHFTDSEELKMLAQKEVERSWSMKELNHELLSFVSKIKDSGYKVALFSNYTSALHDELKRLNISELFDEVIVSGEIGFQKPDPRAFTILFDRLHVSPEEVVFIDDTSRSLEGAEDIGYTPILFTGNQKLFTDLKNLGIIISDT